MNVLSLFDGMSCGQIALERAGIKIDNYYASEIDKYAIQVTMANYPDTIQLGDITKIDISELPKIDLLLGGSPCQGFSFAGKQLNFDDPRSKLFFNFVEILNKIKPTYFLLENVIMKKGHEYVINELLGEPSVYINSSKVSPQDRKRLYWTNLVFDTLQDKKVYLKDILEPSPKPGLFLTKQTAKRYKGNIEGRKQIYKSCVVGSLSKYQGDRVFDINCKGSSLSAAGGNNGGGGCNLVFDPYTNTLRRLSVIECERLQTIPDNYTKCEGVSNTQRYRMIGNGWTVDVIAHIIGAINKEGDLIMKKKFLAWKKDYEIEDSKESSHAAFSPSGSKMWINCTESWQHNRGYSEEGTEAQRGSLAHGLGEFCLRNKDFKLNTVLNEVVASFVIDEDMVYYVQDYVDLVNSYIEKRSIVGIEEKIFINDDCGGTLDASILTGADLHVIDLKYGQGVYVSEIDNPQLKIYAIGKLLASPKINRVVKNIFLHIYQPRHRGTKAHRVYKISKEDLKKWAKEVLLPAIKDIKSGKNLRYCSNEGVCRWCNIKGSCKQLTSKNLELAKVEFKDFVDPDKTIELPNVNKLSNEELTKIMDGIPLFISWTGAIRNELTARVNAGEDIPGYKIVLGNKNRAWNIPEKELTKKLVKAFKKESECYTRKIISPAAAEKKIRALGYNKKILSKYIHKPEGAPLLVSSNDKRQGVSTTAIEDFADFKE